MLTHTEFIKENFYFNSLCLCRNSSDLQLNSSAILKISPFFFWQFYLLCMYQIFIFLYFVIIIKFRVIIISIINIPSCVLFLQNFLYNFNCSHTWKRISADQKFTALLNLASLIYTHTLTNVPTQWFVDCQRQRHPIGRNN